MHNQRYQQFLEDLGVMLVVLLCIHMCWAVTKLLSKKDGASYVTMLRTFENLYFKAFSLTSSACSLGVPRSCFRRISLKCHTSRQGFGVLISRWHLMRKPGWVSPPTWLHSILSISLVLPLLLMVGSFLTKLWNDLSPICLYTYESREDVANVEE